MLPPNYATTSSLSVSPVTVADSVRQAASRDKSDQLNGGHTQRNPSENNAGRVDELSQSGLTSGQMRNAQRSRSCVAAGLRSIAQPVQGGRLSAALQVALDGVNQFGVGSVITFREDLGESGFEGFADISNVDEHQGSNYDLGNNQDQQEEAVGLDQAVRFANGSAAAEERNHEHDRTQDDEEDGRSDDVVVLANLLQLGNLGQRNAANDDQCNTA